MGSRDALNKSLQIPCPHGRRPGVPPYVASVAVSLLRGRAGSGSHESSVRARSIAGGPGPRGAGTTSAVCDLTPAERQCHCIRNALHPPLKWGVLRVLRFRVAPFGPSCMVFPQFRTAAHGPSKLEVPISGQRHQHCQRGRGLHARDDAQTGYSRSVRQSSRPGARRRSSIASPRSLGRGGTA